MNFINSLKNELVKNTLQQTENGAFGHSLSQSALVDFNFKISSYRNMSEEIIINDFMKAYNENKILAMRLLFFIRDCRGGLGERRLFRVIIKEIANDSPHMTENLFNLIAEFGRWDDVFVLFGTPVERFAIEQIAKQLSKDLKAVSINSDSISLLAKWMPSINGSNKERKLLAVKLARAFGMTDKTYRKIISKLRAHLDVVERKMSAKKWSEIKYSAVPSRANLIYNGAFLRNDEERRRQFLGKVEAGEEKIHSATNFPHDIVNSYEKYRAKDTTLEELWKALPNYGALENTLVVADGSGSMESRIGESKITALSVANALAIYFAEHCVGGFKNNYITFSETPQLVNLGSGTLYSKIKIAKSHDEVANTNIEAVFDLILKTALSRRMNQEELPGTILIVSDMEFDACATSNTGKKRSYWDTAPSIKKTLFSEIASRYESVGYKMPKLAFWNVMSRTNTIPVIENEAGVSLVSGFSPAAIKMVLSGKADPYEALVEVLMNPRYDVVEKAIG